MTYRQLIESIEIVAKYNGGLDKKVLEMWAEHDEHGINILKTPSADDLRKLSKMGWFMGCDADYDEEIWDKWENADSLSDGELVELFSNYNCISKYE